MNATSDLVFEHGIDAGAIWKEVKATVAALGRTGWRPLFGWFLALAVGGICIGVAAAYLRAGFSGEAVPDMGGGLANMIVAMVGALGASGLRGAEKWAQDRLGWPTGGMGPGAATGA